MGLPLNPNQSIAALNPRTENRREVSKITLIASSAGLNNKYFLIWSNAGTSYHVWFNRAAGGSDPAPGVSTGIEVAIGASDTAAQVAAAVKTALEVETFGVTREGAVLQITDGNSGPATNIEAGDSGLTVETLFEGAAETYAPGMSPADISNNPSV